MATRLGLRPGTFFQYAPASPANPMRWVPIPGKAVPLYPGYRVSVSWPDLQDLAKEVVVFKTPLEEGSNEWGEIGY